jgi:hypothetical protein
MKQYVGISRDHSQSMAHIARPACRDYNNNIATIQIAARENAIDTIVNVVKCGVGTKAAVIRETVNSNVQVLRAIPEAQYVADGYGTPLFDSIGELIEMMAAVPDADDLEVSFLVMVITDGQENRSGRWTAARLTEKIKQLQNTDRWTFVFRVPKGDAKTLIRHGIHPGNILEWEQTDRGVEVASAATSTAFNRFYAARSKGETSTTRFYADLSQLSTQEVKANLEDISGLILQLYVPIEQNRIEIREFVTTRNGSYSQGSAYYQLTKTEKVQERKHIIIQDKTTAKFYTGRVARQMLGFPDSGQITVSPRALGNYKVFVQSMSVNRHLMGDTNVVIYHGQH